MSDVESEHDSEAVVIKAPKAKKGKKKVVKNDENERTSNLPPVAEAIMHVLGDCQRSVAGHKRGLTSMLAAMGKVDSMGAFMQYFTPALDRILVVFKREPGVERLVKFVGLMATHSVKKHAEQRDQFLDSLLRYLMVRSTAKDKAVRFRCCQLVATVLHALDPEAEIAEDLFDEVEASMLLRSRDKIPVVRVQAIMALSRLQTEEADCPVTEEFERILRTDSSKDARKAVLNELAVSPRSRDLVLERMHDVSPEVRKEAYGVVKSKFLLQSLTIKQRNFIVRTGLKERDDGVKKACSAVLLTSWLPAANNNIITLMRTLDVLQYTQEVELLAAHLLKESGSKNETPSPPYTQDELTPESALYWQLSCQLGVSKEDFLPDTVALCQLIESVSAAEPVAGGPDESVAEDEESRFVLEQLLRLCLLVDLQDEAGRKQLESLCSTLLCNKSLPETMIGHVTRVMRSYFGRDEHGYLRAVLETLSDIRDPLEATGTDNEADRVRGDLETRFANTNAEITQALSEVDMYREMAQHDEAAKVILEVKGLHVELALIEEQLASSVFQDEATWLRMVHIAADILEHTKLDLASHAGLRDLHDTTILPALKLGTGLLRAAALKSLGLYCGLDLTGAQGSIFFPTFQEALEDDDAAPGLQQVAAMAVFDLLLAHANLLREEQEAPLLEALYRRMAPAGETELEDCIVQGLSKLLLFGRLGQLSSEELLTKLLLLYFDPSTELSPSTRQFLSVFFPTLEARKTGGRCVSLTTCLVPAVRALIHAPNSSTLSKVLPNQICAFVISLLMEDQAKNAKEEPATMRLAMDLTLAVLHTSDGSLVKVLCQALPMLELMPTAANAAHVKALLHEAEDAVSDKVSQKALTKTLQGLKKVPAEALEAADESLAEIKEAAFARLDLDAAKYPKLKAKAAPKAKATSRRRQLSGSEEEENSEEEDAPAPKKQPKKTSKPKGSKPKKASKAEVEEEEKHEDEDEGEEESETEEEEAPAPSRRSARAGTKVSYAEANEAEFTDSDNAKEDDVEEKEASASESD